MDAIDYRLTDPYLDPSPADDSWCAERSFRLPETFWCYDPMTDRPPVNELPALSCGYVTFGSLNKISKMNPKVLELWSRVLHAVADSRLMLLAPAGDARDRIIRTMESFGVQPERLLFLPRSPHDLYLQAYHRIDVMLDTFPCNGHTTSLDALWMGVPLVSLVGRTPVGRAGFTQLCNLALREFAAETFEKYVDVAVRLASDLPSLAQLRSTLRQRMERSPLMDAPRFARNIESAYRTMWRDWCSAHGVGG
jgi:predicted O-linked N-acetylglucosamine transferase (SPINDLY family)